jgi:AcrR family transcriptional regulator
MKIENHQFIVRMQHSTSEPAMNMRARLSPEEIRARILEVAEEHFRRIGYAKTAMADIAHALGMSAANVYRFFPSKGAINEAIAHRLLEAQHEMLRAIIADRSLTASQRLAAMAMGIHRYNRDQFTAERRMFDMVEVAMTENWPVIHNHLQTVVGYIAQVIAEGIANGEFPPQDVAEAARSFKQCHVAVLHPTMIAQCIDPEDQEAATRRLTAFALRALTQPPVRSSGESHA